ncbi:MAG: GAF domain-containing protein [Chloroflexi bacterium]|nr:GAF domain-containing protein [Chloroflexota bacterium]
MEFQSQHLIDSLPMGILITDYEGNILAANATLRAMLGYGDNITDQNVVSLSADDASTTEKNAIETVKSGSAPTPYVKELLTLDGEPRPVRLQAAPMRGDVEQALFTVEDLSEEMKLLSDLQRRNSHLLASSEVSRVATQIHDTTKLITKCVDLIRIHFGFYYAAIFLISDDGHEAVLEAATGDAGQKLLEQGHSLEVGSVSMVGWVTANNAARIALDVGEETVRFDNPMLPKTRSEMALPLRVRGEVVGALDVQSTSVNAFSEEDIQTIQMMADQVAIAIDNARLFSQLSSS